MSDIYTRVYSNVSRYEKVNDHAVRNFMEMHENGNNDSLPILADYLEDHDDPRQVILRRHLGQTQHPEGYDWKKEWSKEPEDNPQLIITQGSSVDKGANTYGFAPSAYRGLLRSKPKAIMVTWSHTFVPEDKRHETPSPIRSNNTHMTAMITPDEGRQMAEMLGGNHKDKLNEFIDTHFGKKE